MLLKKHVKAFTLVELIVVITILAILATIAFVSFQGYSVSARDGGRLSDIRVIEKGLGIHRTKGNLLPLPDDAVTITASGSTIAYQGNAGTGVLIEIKQAGNIKDPILLEPYTYSVTENRADFQLLGYFENETAFHSIPSQVAQSYAMNHSEMYPRVFADAVGTLLNPSDNSPLQTLTHTGNTVDILNTAGAQYTSIMTNSDKVEGTGSVLVSMLPNRSCKRIADLGNSRGDGMYAISPDGEQSVDVYCDMTHNGGGWTVLFSVDPASVTWKYDSTQWTNPSIDTDVSDIITTERTSEAYSVLKTNNIAICRGVGNCYEMDHNMFRTLESFYDDNISYVDFSRGPEGILPDDVGVDNTAKYFSTIGIDYTPLSFYEKYGAGINIHDYNRIGFQADHNNGWPGVDNIVVGIGGEARHGSTMNMGCVAGTPYNQANALSVMVPYRCMYEGVADTKMWYVMGK